MCPETKDKAMNLSEKKPVNRSEYAAESYVSVRNKTMQPPVYPSGNNYECVRGRLLIRPNMPMNPSEKNYIYVQNL